MSDQGKASLLVEQKRVEAILKNKNATTYWVERKKSYEEVQKSLEHYAGKLKEQIMVPVGKRGLMRGQIINTNQVFVSLGGGWFVKVCSAEAQQICSRKISECIEMLVKMEKERKLFEGWSALSRMEVFAKEGTEEIIEPYNEQEELSWRERHAEKVKKHRSKLAELRHQLEESRSKEKHSEEELWKHLELLELQEEFQDELDRLNENSESDSEATSTLDSDDDSNPEEEETSFNEFVAERIPNQPESSIPEEKDNKQTTNKFSSSLKNKNQNKNDNKLKGTTKRVRFESSTDLDEKDHITEGKLSASAPQRELVAVGEVFERSNDSICQKFSKKETRPVSKFKSSKLTTKSCSE